MRQRRSWRIGQDSKLLSVVRGDLVLATDIITSQDESESSHSTSSTNTDEQRIPGASCPIPSCSICLGELECISPCHFRRPASSRIDHSTRQGIYGLLRIAECLPKFAGLRLGKVMFRLWSSGPSHFRFLRFFIWRRMILSCVVSHGELGAGENSN